MLFLDSIILLYCTTLNAGTFVNNLLLYLPIRSNILHIIITNNEIFFCLLTYYSPHSVLWLLFNVCTSSLFTLKQICFTLIKSEVKFTRAIYTTFKYDRNRKI